MPSETPAPAPAAAVPPAFAISPAERAKLQQCFQHGTRIAATDIDYAIEMFSTCVLGDVANTLYLQSLFTALRKKHGSKAGGGLTSLWSAGSRGGLRKLAAAGKWLGAMTHRCCAAST